MQQQNLLSTLVCLLLLLLISPMNAQAPAGFNFQAVARDAGGNTMTSESIAVRVSLLRGGAAGTVAYSERHAVSTSELGVFDLQIGSGTGLSGDMGAIDWGTDTYYLKIELDPAGGTNYVDMGATQLLSVPYALYATTAGNGGGGSGTDDQTLSLTGTTLKIENGNSVDLATVRDGVDDADPDPTNELQTLNLTGTTLTLSDANNVDLSSLAGSSPWTEDGTDVHRVAGRIGIGTAEPDESFKLHIAGHTFLQTNLGDLHFGFPNNGHRFKMSTRNQGATFQIGSKPTGSNSYTHRLRIEQSGEVKLGSFEGNTAWLHVRNNSTVSKPHLKLEEQGDDFARLEFTNTTSDALWHIAGYGRDGGSGAAASNLNFYFRNSEGAANRMTVTGDGQVGINTANPGARLFINQAGQTVGSGLAFSDGTANQDWHVTHGFGLRLHYGNSLRGFFSATTGAYTVASDASLKTDVQEVTGVLDRVAKLRVRSYRYKAAPGKTPTIGLVAQETIQHFPELVTYSEADGLYGIDYAGFGIVAIRAIQEQQETIDAQAHRIGELEAHLQRIEAVLARR
ncbi:hypothetical protein LEM8419_01888 [Neolewinella maritima]|uniref:Peptidase S74 domain-containing protein n=1 Tax=Neolewinella maritima TaxID=1383882 RepID=A0ABM9B0X2_9BACT|nr:tail fiber domain-containing protein [Neolewinella maritima]CAH1000795.1 hypothetical protein LEM8419_01888 [Neolewinella maritima]